MIVESVKKDIEEESNVQSAENGEQREGQQLAEV